MEPDKITALATSIYCVAFLIFLVFVWRQLVQMRKSTMATAFSKALEIIQSESVRDDRGKVFEMQDKSYGKWDKEEKKIGERVCHTYDQVGIMIRAGMFPKILIVDSWGYSLRRIWPILKPLVYAYRLKKDSDEFWDDFEWLAGEAIKFKAKMDKKKKP